VPAAPSWSNGARCAPYEKLSGTERRSIRD
jgi:hypothetical protein